MTTLGVFKVSSVVPAQDSQNILVTTDIRITFNTDVDRSSLPYGIIVLAIRTGLPVPGSISYDGNRTAIFTPSIMLSPATAYSVVVRNSIKNILGVQCQAYEFSFTTKSAPALSIVTLTPADQALLSMTPEFSWKSALGANGYEIEVSKTTDFAVFEWASVVKCESAEATTERVVSITPHVGLNQEDTYFWRVRAYTTGNETNYGDYSTVRRFKITSGVYSVVTPEDTPYIDPAYQDLTPPVPIVADTFPEDGFSNVATNLKTMYFRIKGILNPLAMDPRKWLVSGTHVSEDVNLPTYSQSVGETLRALSHHGDLNGSWSIVVDDVNKETVIVFQPVTLNVLST